MKNLAGNEKLKTHTQNKKSCTLIKINYRTKIYNNKKMQQNTPSMDNLKSGLDTAKERISELEDKAE